MWLTELLEDHPTCVVENLGMQNLTFQMLSNLIVEKSLWVDEPYQLVDISKRLAMFLCFFNRANHYVDLAERFQHSTETICGQIMNVSRILVLLAHDIIREVGN